MGLSASPSQKEFGRCRRALHLQFELNARLDKVEVGAYVSPWLCSPFGLVDAEVEASRLQDGRFGYGPIHLTSAKVSLVKCPRYLVEM